MIAVVQDVVIHFGIGAALSWALLTLLSGWLHLPFVAAFVIGGVVLWRLQKRWEKYLNECTVIANLRIRMWMEEELRS